MKARRWYWLFGVFLAILIFLTIWTCLKGGEWQILLTPIALVLAGTIAYQQLEHARHARCAELLLNIMRWWNSDEMLESRLLVWKMQNAKAEILKLYQAKDKKFGKVIRMGQFGESLGIMVLRNYINVKDIWLLFENDWGEVYQDYSGYLEELKKKDALDTTFCNLKWLCEELAKIHAKDVKESS